MSLLFSSRADRPVPFNIVREGRRTRIFVGLPRSLSLGKVTTIMHLCSERSFEHGAYFEGRTITGTTAEGKNAPRMVMVVSTVHRNEAAVTEELLAVLREQLPVPVVPAVRH